MLNNFRLRHRAAAWRAARSWSATPALSGSVDSTYAGTDLRASTARPWNPPRAVPAAEPWESVLRFPGRIISLPLSALGRATDLGLLHVDDRDVVVHLAFQAMVACKR